jgi:hypothetical protein
MRYQAARAWRRTPDRSPDPGLALPCCPVRLPVDVSVRSCSRATVVFRNSGYGFLFLFGLALIAFWPMYISRLPGGGIDAHTHVHAIVMALWFGLLIVQPFLIKSGRLALHRRLGMLSLVLAPFIAISGAVMAHMALDRDAADLAQAAPALYLALAMTAWFSASYGLAMVYRKDPPVHARLMICTNLALIDPIVGRILPFYFAPFEHPIRYQAVSFALSLAGLGILMFVERRRPRGRAVFPVMVGVTVVVYGLWFTLAQSTSWIPVARWFHHLRPS